MIATGGIFYGRNEEQQQQPKGMRMNIAVTNQQTGRTSIFTPKQLRKDAAWAVKGKGKLVEYFVQIQEGACVGATAILVAVYQGSDGFNGQVSLAI